MEIVDKDIPGPGAIKVRIKVQACGIYHSGSFTTLKKDYSLASQWFLAITLQEL
jgi:Zn-dependent alcohol dehydrogenase